MPVDLTHPDYEVNAPAWARARDVLSGEDAVKAGGKKYLPRMDSQSDDEFNAYTERASFFGATAHTLEEYLDLIFRRAPVLALDGGEELTRFVRDCDLWGLDFLRYARRVVGEVLSVGRGGSLVLRDGRLGEAALPGKASSDRSERSRSAQSGLYPIASRRSLAVAIKIKPGALQCVVQGITDPPRNLARPRAPRVGNNQPPGNAVCGEARQDRNAAMRRNLAPRTQR